MSSAAARIATLINPWGPQDAAALRRFLQENPKFVAELENRMPRIVLDSTERAAMTGAAHAGAENLIDNLLTMATEDRFSERSPFLGAD